MVEAVWYGCTAAGLPPLHERREHQNFFASQMGRALLFDPGHALLYADNVELRADQRDLLTVTS
ncbi:hypothetical protein [Streptomyces sp. NPDC057002]|uniref:hypothetical protein n=1 Tax=Streptomyces sp. NPDC057002 TaxID=3345992 RepID=UPI0036341F10